MPLVDDVGHNAVAAGVLDPRAAPLEQGDVDALDFELSILSPLEPISFADRPSACDALRVGVDGVVFSSGRRRATLLPSMWDRLPDARRVPCRRSCRRPGARPTRGPTTRACGASP